MLNDSSQCDLAGIALAWWVLLALVLTVLIFQKSRRKVWVDSRRDALRCRR